MAVVTVVEVGFFADLLVMTSWKIDRDLLEPGGPADMQRQLLQTPISSLSHVFKTGQAPTSSFNGESDPLYVYFCCEHSPVLTFMYVTLL